MRKVIRAASEPIFRYKQGSQWRTKEHWVELIKRGNNRYMVCFGDCRGIIQDSFFADLQDANDRFEFWKTKYDMEDDEIEEIILPEKVVFS